MVPQLEDLTYQERLKEMHLTLIERRERSDLIIIYKLMNNLEETDKKNFILRRKGEAKNLRGHKKKLRKGICLNDIKEYSFSPRSIDTWIGLKEEVIMAVYNNYRKDWINIDAEIGPHECRSSS